MDFRCGANNTAAVGSNEAVFFPCQHEATCVVDSIAGQVCQGCPPGWEHDVYGFAHFYNCAIPSVVPFVFCVVHGCLLGLGLILVAYLFLTGQVAKGKTRTVLSMNVTCSVLAWISVLAAYIQRGFYEGSLVSLLILGLIGLFIAPTIVPVLLRPIASMTSNLVMLRTVTKVSWTLAIFSDITYLCLMIAAIVLCRDTNPRNFNAITLTIIWFLIMVLTVQGIAVFGVSRRLATYISTFSSKSGERDANSNSPSQNGRLGEAVERRQKSIVQQLNVIASFVAILMLGLLCLLIPTVLWSIFGSLPYLWVFHFGAFALLTFTFPLLVPFVRGSSPTSKSGRNMISSSGQGHILSEGADIVEIPQYRGLGIKKPPRRKLPWKIRVGKVLSKISEEQSRAESSIASRFIAEHPRQSTGE